MSKARVYLRNITANWVGYGLNLVIMFFMSPFVVRTLGDERYGVWSLLMSLTGYLGLVEIGTRAGLGRYINYYLGKEDTPKLNATISTAMAMFCVVGVVLFLVAGALAVFVDTLFSKIPANVVSEARIVILCVAANLFLSFLSAAFKQLLQAFERFELTNATDLAVLALRTSGMIAVLVTVKSLALMAVVHVAGGVLGVAMNYLMARRQFPALELRPRLITRGRFREIFGFSVWAFVNDIGMRLLYTTDTLVIMILLGPKEVTYYAVGGMLLMRSRGLVLQGTRIFSPQIIQYCAKQDWKGLRILFKRGSNLAMAVTIPIMTGLIMFGHEFLTLWMGPLRADRGYPVLCILASSQFFALAWSITGSIYSGLNRVKLGALLIILQGIINLGLTLVFVLIFNMGIEGVAWGTFYPGILLACLSGYLAMRWIGLTLSVLISALVWRWVMTTVLFFAACWSIDAMMPMGTWSAFFVRVVLAMVCYIPLACIILASREDRRRICEYVTSKLHRRIDNAT